MKLMLTDRPKQCILPFQRDHTEQVEAGAILALAELERTKSSGFINKRLGEKILFIAKSGYPLWLYSRNGKTYFFDGINNSNFIISYAKLPSAQTLKQDLQEKEIFLKATLNTFQVIATIVRILNSINSC
jgi:hypothetical protein